MDEETGLYYFGARYYDPRVSVWISTDGYLEKYLPLGSIEKDQKLPGLGGIYNSMNISLYAYAHKNPVKNTDPDGNAVCGGICIGVAIALAYLSSPADLNNPGGTTENEANANYLMKVGGVKGAVDGISAAMKQTKAPVSPDIKPKALADKSPEEIANFAEKAGLKPKGKDPVNGQGSFVDPVNGKQRIRIDTNSKTGDSPHYHVYNKEGQALDMNGSPFDKSGKLYLKDAPETHLPLK